MQGKVLLSPPLTLFALLSAVTLLLLMVLFWRHNQTITSVGTPERQGENAASSDSRAFEAPEDGVGKVEAA